MNRIKHLFVVAVLALATGCATTNQTPVSGSSTETAKPASAAPAKTAEVSTEHVQCTAQLQIGCIEVRVLNFKYDAQVHAKAITATTAREQQLRAQNLGPAQWGSFVKGETKASRGRTFLVFAYNIGNVSAANLSAYRVNGDATRSVKHTVVKADVKEVTGTVPVATFDSATTARLGTPRVFRITAEGADAVGASIQVPWSVVGGNTHLIICTEDSLTVFPSKIGTQLNGHHVSKETLMHYKKVGELRVLAPFFSNDPAAGTPPAPARQTGGTIALVSVE